MQDSKDDAAQKVAPSFRKDVLVVTTEIEGGETNHESPIGL